MRCRTKTYYNAARNIMRSFKRAFKHFLDLCKVVYLEPCETSKMEHLAKIVKGCQPLTIFAKSSVLDVGLGSECSSGFLKSCDEYFKLHFDLSFYKFSVMARISH